MRCLIVEGSRLVAQYIFYLLFSILATIMAYYIAKGVDEYLNKNKHIAQKWQGGDKIRKYMIKYPWLFGLLMFIAFVIIDLFT